MTTRARTLASLAALGLAVLLLAPLVHLARVHAATWDWAWSPAAAPTRVQVDGRHHLRADHAPPLTGLVVQRGRTDGGGTVLVPAGTGTGQVAVVLEVRDGDRVVLYSLSGGP